MNHEDWRYEMLRNRAPKIAVLTDLVAIHLIPTTIVFMGMLPVFAVFIMGSSPFSWIDILAVLVGVGAVSLQMISDFQLRAISANKDSNESLARELNIRSVPTTVIFSEGVEVERFIGAKKKELVKNILGD